MDPLSLEQQQAALVTDALKAGEWIAVQDEKGRTVYYNQTTKETTRDLRIHLLRTSGWDMLSSRHRELKQTQQEAQKRKLDGLVEVYSEEEKLKQQLIDAKALIEAYESEVTWLRLSLLEAEKKLDPGEVAVAETNKLLFNTTRSRRYRRHDLMLESEGGGGSNEASANSAATAAAGGGEGEGGGEGKQKRSASPTDLAPGLNDVKALKEKLRESRKLNQKLLTRVSQDRELKHLCSRCLQEVDSSAAAVGQAREGTLHLPGGGGVKQPFSLTVPGGVGFPSTLSNPAQFDAVLLSRGMENVQASHAAVKSVGFLPRGYDPIRSSIHHAYESPRKDASSARRGGGSPSRQHQQEHQEALAAPPGESQLHKNLAGLQMLRASLEGDYRLDAHVRDPARNDFFGSAYFSASLKGKVAGSKSNSNPAVVQQERQQEIQDRQQAEMQRLMQQYPSSGGQQQQRDNSPTRLLQQQHQQQLQNQNNSSHSSSRPVSVTAQIQSNATRKLSSQMPGGLYSGGLFRSD